MTIHITPLNEHRRRVRTSRPLGRALVALALASLAGCQAARADEVRAIPTTAPGEHADTAAARVAPQPTSAARESTPPTSSTPPATSTPRPARPTERRDRLVAVNGARMHISCGGAGSSTVVLIAGFESASDSWSAVAPALAERTRVCTYDRPGLGASEPATATTAAFAAQAGDLHALLTAAGEPGPYLVVGHSFGGLAAIEFADRFADEVDALVLVDASPIGWPRTLCSIADDGTGAATFIRGMCAGWADPSANAEHLDVFAAFADAATAPSLGSLPVAVITAVDRQLPPDITDAERARLTDAWDEGQRRWAQLSAASRLTSVPDTGHLIQLDQPAAVIGEIERLLP